MELLTNATVIDDAIRFVATNPNNKESTITTKATGEYKTDDIPPVNLVNEDQLGVENNTTMTCTTNRIF
jgi:hypothetical protein